MKEEKKLEKEEEKAKATMRARLHKVGR